MADEVKVDLVVLMDTSGSMQNESKALSDATQTAVDRVKGKCPNDLRVAYLGVEGTWPGTNFNMSLRDYLTREAGVPESSLKAAKYNPTSPYPWGPKEDGAPSIEDTCNFFDWRTDALRTILYLSDDSLKEGGGEPNAEDIAAATSAIATAKKNKVTVFTYLGAHGTEKMKAEYARLATGTGGKPFTSKDAIGGFTDVLADVVCSTKAKGKEKEKEKVIDPIPDGNGTDETKETTNSCCVPVYVYPVPMSCMPAPGCYPMPAGCLPPGMMGGQPMMMMPQPGMMGGQPMMMMPQPGMMGGQPMMMMPQPGMMGGQPMMMMPQPGTMGA